MAIIKRNGDKVQFQLNKIESAIRKCFNACGSKINDEQLLDILTALKVSEVMHVEEIQNEVENTLMNLGYFKEVKSYIIYREKHKENREIEIKKEFIKDYINSSNAATGSKFDSNANVTEKNIATMSGEIFKRDVILLNRSILKEKIKSIYSTELSEQYTSDLESHLLYKNDETNLAPYCVAITMYPYLFSGLKDLGGLSSTPKNLDSFCGTFINLCFAVSSQFAGALATGEFFLYFDYFCRKEWGDNYYNEFDTIIRNISLSNHNTIKDEILQKFQQIVYSLNQPAAARSYQSIFWNISYFDKHYFEGLFGSFIFPDGSEAKYDSVNWLQKTFMRWFNEERTKTILTFPVETVAMLTDNNDIVDKDWADFSSEMYSKGHSFFTYLSDNPDSLSSCCRLRNEIIDNQFSYSLGAGGVATGSKSVMTININRLIQNNFNKGVINWSEIEEVIKRVQKYQTAYNSIIEDYFNAKMLPVYSAGFITLEKQYLTLGVNGVVEAAEFLGIAPDLNNNYLEFINKLLSTFNKLNKEARTKKLMFNTEFVPAESLGIKNAKWDKEDGLFSPRECYNSYFYRVEDDSLTIIDKFKLHGKEFVKYLDGGSALHCNLEEHLSQKQYRQLLKIAVKEGTNYFTFNIPNTVCNDCGTIDKRYLHSCSKCNSKNVDYLTRVIGYLKRVSNFSENRQKEASERFYGVI